MKPQNAVQNRWYATRTVPMPDEDQIESVLIWIERRAEDGEWAVGRATDLAQRDFAEPRENDYVFNGFEIDDALQAANEALEDDLVASEDDGVDPNISPFLRRELQEPLNDWFWGRRDS